MPKKSSSGKSPRLRKLAAQNEQATAPAPEAIETAPATPASPRPAPVAPVVSAPAPASEGVAPAAPAPTAPVAAPVAPAPTSGSHEGNGKHKKTECPVSRKEFKEGAPSVVVTINGSTFHLVPREFGTGSLGWNLSDKTRVLIGGVEATVQIGLNLTVVGSKDLPPSAS